MKLAKVITPVVSARARKTARNSDEAAAGGIADEPIYKAKRMHTVGGMFKRILILGSGVLLTVERPQFVPEEIAIVLGEYPGKCRKAIGGERIEVWPIQDGLSLIDSGELNRPNNRRVTTDGMPSVHAS